uniref:Protein Nef n=1 Tax=Human immunodeficiency virus type 1 TaxID=11676 RepID=A0A286LH96_HV1|nr:nef protein [Human immunodeficiency virus 1]
MGGNRWKSSIMVGREEGRRIEHPPPPAAAVGAAFQDEDNHRAAATSNINPSERVVRDAQQEEEGGVGFPVKPQVPVRPMTYKGALDLSHFLREKGGLEGLIYSRKRQEILDLWVYNTQGYFPDWQNYTPGPGIRYPLTFGWCFKLVPVDPEEVEKATEGENNSLLHPMCQHGVDDEERETLMWKFDSYLAFKHQAREMHPEFYKD